MAILYGMMGYRDDLSLFMATDLTAAETQEAARREGLNGFHRAPMNGSDYPAAKCASFLQDDQRPSGYRSVEMFEWLNVNYNYARVHP